jgi:hypothetical protein
VNVTNTATVVQTSFTITQPATLYPAMTNIVDMTSTQHITQTVDATTTQAVSTTTTTTVTVTTTKQTAQ